MDLDLAAAVPAEALSLPRVEARPWGPKLRYCTTAANVESFWEHVRSDLAPFVLFGSGDFHHLSALWQRRVVGPYDLVCFDNHPDWDIRPPRWACGGWVVRVLENPKLHSASVWGCGNFELTFPSSLFRTRDARLDVHPWADRLPASSRSRYPCISPQSWRDRFSRYADSLAGRPVYITIDLDCLQKGAAYSNWEHGLFQVDDLRWAITQLRARANLVGGDICGAWSDQQYDGWFQRFAARWDHPTISLPELVHMWRVNAETTIAIWKALVGA